MALENPFAHGTRCAPRPALARCRHSRAARLTLRRRTGGAGARRAWGRAHARRGIHHGLLGRYGCLGGDLGLLEEDK